MARLLDSIHTPLELRKLSKEQLPLLAREVRDWIIETVADKGGHLGGGLGVTDLAIALHYCLDTPNDFLVWDVGHQVQPHKVLTGRKDAFRKTFREYKGISGLVNASESPYDPFTTGHGGPSISAALGVAVARRLKNKKSRVVAVIGDTSIASGMAFEALNHAGHLQDNIVVILNDNKMSISPSVGALSKYLSRVLSDPRFNHLRNEIEKLVRSVPKIGEEMLKKLKHVEESVRHLLVPGRLFEDLGFRYVGPLDGHNVLELVDILPNIFKMQGPVLVHVLTQKGKGMDMAEKDPVRWHASTPFDVRTGELKKKSAETSYTKIFGQTICRLADSNPLITAVTGGMPEGTGLLAFGEKFPARFFDVGISEEHAVTVCAGMAFEGMRPVAAIYSTFLQRAFDQIIHDVALQNLPVMFCIDRAGLVGEDGPTHHGVFDLSYLRKIPNLVLMAPRDGKELEAMIAFMVACTDHPTAVRYPRGAVAESVYPALADLPRSAIELGRGERLRAGDDICFVAVGSMVGPALEAARLLESDGISSSVINARFVKPLDESLILREARNARLVVTVEEGSLPGGFGSAVLELLAKNGVDVGHALTLGIPDRFIEAGSLSILLDLIGLTPNKIAQSANSAFRRLASSPAQVDPLNPVAMASEKS